MFWLILLLLSPVMVRASCLDNNDPAYNLAVSQGNYEAALKQVARELRLTPSEERHFKVIQGYSQSHDDRNGQADPESLELRLDPGLFLEGKEGACQGMAHELEHLKQFERDRRVLHAYYARHTPTATGWNLCEKENFVPDRGQSLPISYKEWDSTHDPQKAEEDAYDCLQDNDLITHAASDDIEAVLAQVPYAKEHKLRDDDLDYLLEKLKAWTDNVSLIQDQSNVSYYLPEIKRRDTRLFCRGVLYVQERRLNAGPFNNACQIYCRVKPGRS